VQLLRQAVNASIANVRAVDERKKPETEKPRYDMEVEFAIETLVELWRD